MLGIGELFGCDELRCAQPGERTSQVAVSIQIFFVTVLDEAEVGQLHLAVNPQQDVVRLDVAVNDALLMRVMQCLGHERYHSDSLCLGKRASPVDSITETFPFD